MDKLRQYPEFAAFEKAAGPFSLTTDESNISSYNPKTNTINIRPSDLTREYGTVLPPEGLTYEQEDSYPKWYKFSPERALFHEAFHSTQDASALRYSVSMQRYEQEAIDATNGFMAKHFNEPYQGSYEKWR